MKKMTYFIIIIIIGLGFFFWSSEISTKGLIVKEYAVKNKKLPKNFVGTKIVHFSDLHFASTVHEKELKNIVEKINNLKPDICVFTGDLIEREYKLDEQKKDFMIKELGKIKARLGKFAVIGNHDYEHEYFDELLTEAGFQVLNNSHQLIFNKTNTPIVIAGTTSLLQSHQKLDKTFSFQEKEKEEHFTIFLAHEPDTLKKARKYTIDLMLSGHSHGGQVRLPFIGAIITPLGSKTYYEEYYKVDETDLYISSGIGTSTLRVRFFNKPSINLIRIYDK